MIHTTDMHVPGYRITESLSGNRNTVVYRARRDPDQRPVVLKTLSNDYPSLKSLARFRREFELVSSLEGEGLLHTVEMRTVNGRHVIVYDDIGGLSLHHLLRNGRLAFEDVLHIVLELARQLAVIHEQQVVHKDINPANIVFNEQSRQVQLIDFSIALRIPREMRRASVHGSLEGTLPYISPEQTGRMNRSLDYRTDFYSLGITFYELLTGSLPFNVTDPMEMVHCHIAREAKPPHEVDPKIARVVSRIVMKLMAKNAENRYQSAYGLIVDLERCVAEWEAQRVIPDFEIAARDLRHGFRIPQKLYGREQELEVMRQTIARIGDGANELLLISGHSGVGKSALINEIHKPMARYRGFLISGKFDQYQRNTPYTSLIQACRELIRQLLTESDENLRFWRQRILKEMGSSATLMVEVIPELATVLRETPKLQALPSAEAENRFHLAFRSFLGTFAREGHPLVIFFDDLQWADLATLKLIRLLVTDTDIRSLLLIGTYRDEEVDEGHPLSNLLLQLSREDVKIHSLFLERLAQSHIVSLVSETLHQEPTKVMPLAALVYDKTQGNPFFVNEFLKSLYERELIEFDATSGTWHWDIKAIKRLSITEDAVAFMAEKLQRLDGETRDLLTLAACIGSSFDLEDLARVYGETPGKTMAVLGEAVTEGLLMPLDDSYMMVGRDGEAEIVFEDVTYEFLHDQVQQAAYSLIGDTRKQETHLRIGRQLMKYRNEAEVEEDVFDIVNHLNLATDLMGDIGDRLELSHLNLIAGRKARLAGAYEPALTFLQTGLDLLDDDPWSVYELAMPLCMELAECRYLNGEIGAAEQLFDQAQTHALSPLEQAAIYQTRTVLYAHLGKYVEAIEVGLEGLSLFDIQIPYMDDQLQGEIAETLTSIREQMEGKQPEDLIDLPQLQDPFVYAAINQLINLWSPASNVNLNLMKLLVLKIVDLSLTYGNVDVSSYGYVGYALVLGSGFGDYRTGEAFGELGLRLNDQFCNLELKCRVYFVHGALVKPWRAHIRESGALLQEAFEAGLESGDIMWASVCRMHMPLHRMLAGDQLQSIEQDVRAALSFMKKARYEQSQETLLVVKRMLSLLRADIEVDPSWNTPEFEETAFLTRNQRKLYLVAVNHYYTCKIQFAYLFGDYEVARRAADRAEKLRLYKFGWPSLAEQLMFSGLTHAALWASSDEEGREHLLDTIHDNLERLEKWARECPENFRCRYLLLAAETARVTVRFEAALNYFDEAIESARAGEFTHIEALGNELAGRFLLSKNKVRLARVYLREALYLYERWGATAKVAQMNRQYDATLLGNHGYSEVHVPSFENSTTTQDSMGALDLTTFMKASLAISSEIQLDRLLMKLMQIVMENAGAQKGFLFLKKDERLLLEAECRVDDHTLSVLQSRPLSECEGFSRGILNYVHHSREVVVTANAVKEGNFISDPYIVSTRAKSVLCQPIMNKGQLMGILYLENNLVSGAFTPYRLETLQMLTSEASVFIENARLYADLAATGERLQQSNRQLEQANFTLEQKVEERTAALKQKNEELQATLVQVKEMQQQIIQQEKMASLGTLSAGIAHEIRNPLNFVNNFATISQELLEELQEELSADVDNSEERLKNREQILKDLVSNLGKIHEHGQRADDIVHSMLMHSHRKAADKPKPTDINKLLEKFLNLAYHSMRAKNPFRMKLEKFLAEDLPEIEAVPQDLGRVFLNVIENAFDSMRTRLARDPQFRAHLQVRTALVDNKLEIRIRDNGAGIEQPIQGKIFNPFFTTKPAGQGTGLGLSISYDIVVKEHQGHISVESEVDHFTEFLIQLPRERYKPDLVKKAERES